MAALAALASFVRGYSGFGFAALIMAGATLVTDPIPLVAAILLCDMALTAAQAPSIRGEVEWGRVLPLLAGAVAGVPLGVALFAWLPPEAGRAAVSAWVLLMCAALWMGWRMARAAGRAAHAGVGVVSGLANGAAVGGLPVAAFFAAQPMAAARVRGTLVTYFAALDAGTLLILAARGDVGLPDLLLAALALPVMLVFVLLGGRRFLATPPEDFRRFAILLLAGLALLGLARSLL